MSAIKATWKNGLVVLEARADWPEGRRLLVTDDPIADDEPVEDPESIARWIEEFDAIPPLEMTPEEEAQWQEARQVQREQEKATFNQRAESLRRLCE